jgi:DNA-binding PadR family transcriptional regulator
MFRDNSLIPAEAVRLAALGFLAEAPRRYGDLAAEIRHFTGRIVGPSLDLMGTSLELMRFEGLIEAVDGEGMADNAVLRPTAAGRAALLALLKAQLRSPLADMNRLALFLKLRFLHHLSPEDQTAQRALVAEALEGERARFDELRHHPGAPVVFGDWLAREVALLDDRIAWLRGNGG